MAFEQYKLEESVHQTRGIFNEYIYSTLDTKEDVQASGYFIESRFDGNPSWVGSLITASCSDGFITGQINELSSLVEPLYPFNPTSGIKIERLLDGLSAATSQQPTGTGVANSIKIEFGPDVGTGDDPVNLLSNGTVSLNEAGTYRIKIALQFGRTGGAGTSHIFFRVRVNGVQAGRSIASFISNSEEEQYFENDTWLTVPAGVQLEFDIMRDESGNDSGGLFKISPTVEAGSWNDAPSAAIRVERWV